MARKILITGSAGFVGFHLVTSLLGLGDEIVGIDNINDYYDVGLKYGRLEQTGIGREEIAWHQEVASSKYKNYRFIRMNLEDKSELMNLFIKEKFDYVIHLAAQAGVRYSIDNPDAYIQSNVVGFLNILECCRHNPVHQLVYASSSSVYGANSKIPFSESDTVDTPVSLYAATKKSNELMAYTYSHLYQIPTTGLRFFTVYGPWGRPDMSPILFASAIRKDEPIKVFNNGDMERDFTYVSDIVEGMVRVLESSFDSSKLKYRVMNIGNGNPVHLLKFIELVELNLGKTAEKIFMPMQPGDVKRTWADIQQLKTLTSYSPQVSVEEGVAKFVQWFKQYNSQIG